MMHIEFSPIHIITGYLSIGLLVLALRITYDCCMHVATVARNLASTHNVSVARGAMTLVVCGTALIALAVVCWPDAVRHMMRKWWAR